MSQGIPLLENTRSTTTTAPKMTVYQGGTWVVLLNGAGWEGG